MHRKILKGTTAILFFQLAQTETTLPANHDDVYIQLHNNS